MPQLSKIEPSVTVPTQSLRPELDPARYAVDPVRGFLPPVDPLTRLPASFALWDELGAELPKLLAAQQVGPSLDRLPTLETAELNGAELNRAMLLLSFFGHAYVWETWQEGGRSSVPPGVGIPWQSVAERLGRPPILSYASYALDNWRRIDPAGPIELGNIALLQNFLGGLDEEWFVTVHIDIEAKAGPLLAAIGPAQRAVLDNQPSALEQSLRTIVVGIEGMYRTFLRMPEGCDPYIYYLRVRPYIHGFTEHPVVYTGVAAFGGQPRTFYGETGAQSTIIPTLDAALGIEHRADQLRVYLANMRGYMPPAHRAFLEAVEAGPSIRRYVLERSESSPELRDLYNACVELVEKFRAKHLEYAATYIHQQSQRGGNSTHYGTGGTPFMTYLKKHRDETGQHLLDENPADRPASS